MQDMRINSALSETIVLDMVYNGIAYAIKQLAQRKSFSREVFGKAQASRC